MKKTSFPLKSFSRTEIDEIRGWFEPLQELYNRARSVNVAPPYCTPEERLRIRGLMGLGNLHRPLWDIGLFKLPLVPGKPVFADLVMYEELYEEAISAALEALKTRNMRLWTNVAAVLRISLLDEPRVRGALGGLEIISRDLPETREFLRKALAALAFLGRGDKKKFSEEETQGKKRHSDLLYIQTQRTVAYLEKARQQYVKEKERFEKRGRLTKEILERIAKCVEEETLTRRGEAKKEARSWFNREVNLDLASLPSMH